MSNQGDGYVLRAACASTRALASAHHCASPSAHAAARTWLRDIRHFPCLLHRHTLRFPLQRLSTRQSCSVQTFNLCRDAPSPFDSAALPTARNAGLHAVSSTLSLCTAAGLCSCFGFWRQPGLLLDADGCRGSHSSRKSCGAATASCLRGQRRLAGCCCRCFRVITLRCLSVSV